MRHLWVSRLKVTAVAGVIAAASSLPASAQTEYFGAGYLTDFVGCTGWNGVAQLYARHRPANRPGNQTGYNTFTIFSRSYAFGYRFRTDPPENEWFDVMATGDVGADIGFNPDPQPRPQVRLLPPPAFTTGTEREMHIIFELRDFSYQTGCQARGNFLLYLSES